MIWLTALTAKSWWLAITCYGIQKHDSWKTIIDFEYSLLCILFRRPLLYTGSTLSMELMVWKSEIGSLLWSQNRHTDSVILAPTWLLLDQSCRVGKSTKTVGLKNLTVSYMDQQVGWGRKLLKSNWVQHTILMHAIECSQTRNQTSHVCWSNEVVCVHMRVCVCVCMWSWSV